MEGSQTKRRIFADFSIESLLRKDENSKPKRQEWGIVQHPSFLTTPTTAVPAYFGESYYSYSTSFPDYYAAVRSAEVPKLASGTPVQLEEEEEFISVSDENNETDCEKSCRKSNENNEDSSDSTFSWLNCTRFKPPKLLRKLSNYPCYFRKLNDEIKDNFTLFFETISQDLEEKGLPVDMDVAPEFHSLPTS